MEWSDELMDLFCYEAPKNEGIMEFMKCKRKRVIAPKNSKQGKVNVLESYRCLLKLTLPLVSYSRQQLHFRAKEKEKQLTRINFVLAIFCQKPPNVVKIRKCCVLMITMNKTNEIEQTNKSKTTNLPQRNTVKKGIPAKKSTAKTISKGNIPVCTVEQDIMVNPEYYDDLEDNSDNDDTIVDDFDPNRPPMRTGVTSICSLLNLVFS